MVLGLSEARFLFLTLTFRNVSHGSDFQEITQVEASTKFREPSIMDEDTIGSFSRRNEDQDDLSDLLNSKKVRFSVWLLGESTSISEQFFNGQ